MWYPRRAGRGVLCSIGTRMSGGSLSSSSKAKRQAAGLSVRIRRVASATTSWRLFLGRKGGTPRACGPTRPRLATFRPRPGTQSARFTTAEARVPSTPALSSAPVHSWAPRPRCTLMLGFLNFLFSSSAVFRAPCKNEGTLRCPRPQHRQAPARSWVSQCDKLSCVCIS